jgi:hypothetical protein
MATTTEELLKEREKRIQDATELKQPDRVPIMPLDSGWQVKYGGLSWKEYMYDLSKGPEAAKKMMADLQWDAFPMIQNFPGQAMDGLNFQQLKWAGAELPENRVGHNSVFQFVEPGTPGKYEVMPAEEYDWFLDDPSDYIIRRHWPRIMKAMEPLRGLPPIHDIVAYYAGIWQWLPMFGTPEIATALDCFLTAARDAAEWAGVLTSYVGDMTAMGFPPAWLAVSISPYDYLADFLRGTEGCMIDMFRNPDKLKKAIEKVTPWVIEWGLAQARTFSPLVKRLFIPVHKGAGGFMSNEQFEEFWWPSMREVMIAAIDEGFVPYLYTEGIFTDRLPIIKDIPKGKAIYHIESDIFKAKEILGDTVCLSGGPTATMMNVGSPEEVADYSKKLIDVIGEGGGFIMDVEVPLITAKIENVRALTETVMEYGVY